MSISRRTFVRASAIGAALTAVASQRGNAVLPAGVFYEIGCMVDFQTSQGGKTRIDDHELEALRGALRGSLLMPADAGYDVSRTLWNAMIDRHPAAIVRAASAGDVMHSPVL